MQERRLHLAMRSSDDHDAINRGEWVGVCLCLLWELQQLVWPALGDISGQYGLASYAVIWLLLFFRAKEDNHLNKQIML